MLINLMAYIPHDQSSTAETPHNQSVLSKCWETTCIRTLQMKDKETSSPTSSHTGPSHTKETFLSREPLSSSSIHNPQILQVQTRSSSPPYACPQPPTQVLLPQDVLLLSQQSLEQLSGFPLPILHPISPAPYAYPSWAPGHGTSVEVQYHQQLSEMHMNTESPSRDDTASLLLTYSRH